MRKTRKLAGLVAGLVLIVNGRGLVNGQTSSPVSKILSYKPRQEGVNYSIPSSQEQDNCKVEVVKGSRPGSTGWLLRDPQGRPLRLIFNMKGDADKKPDLWAYYLDGLEVYREIDSRHAGKVDQFRWLNAGGTKWGLDFNGDGKIDSWKIISPEEVSQEVLQAVIHNDFNRLQSLWITDAEIKELELPAAEATRIRNLQKQAAAKFDATVAKLSDLGSQTHWLRLEAGLPQCVPAEPNGLKQDLIKYQKASVLYENKDKHDWLSIGEIIQVGSAWRIIEAPSLNAGGGGGDVAAASDPETQKLLEELGKLDANATRSPETPGPNAAIVRYNLQRADLLLKIIAKAKADDRDQWVRQLSDCYSAAAQSSPADDKTAYQKLVELEQQVARDQAGSATAAYITFREMQADYAVKLAKGPEISKEDQEQWLGRLAKYVKDYPSGEDTPEALLQLAMVSEFMNKEIEAKNWYLQLVKNFPDKKPLTDKAQGALKRLELEGKTLELAGTSLGGSHFDINSLRGKVVVVYYWASYNQQSIGDFARLREMLRTHGPRGLELVCVNLDNSPPEAGSPLAGAPGTQIFQPGGLESPLATQYGIMVLPNIFLVGKDGKVVSRTVQIATLEDEVRKLLK
jgi:hypothetical protein